MMHKILGASKKLIQISRIEYHYQPREESITSDRSARNILDRAEAYIQRYYFYQNEHPVLYSENRIPLLKGCIGSSLYVWLYWSGWNLEEKTINKLRMNKIQQFMKCISLYNNKGLSLKEKISIILMRHSNRLLLSMFHKLFQLNKLIKREL